MKTFEEALAKNYRRAPLDVSPDQIEDVVQDLHEGFGSYACLLDEAQSSEVLRNIAQIWHKIAIEDGVDCACFSAFMAGLVTGIEMEKAE